MTWLKKLPKTKQRSVLKQLEGYRTPQELAAESPANFAAYASNGHWYEAKHLREYNIALKNIVTQRNARLIVEMPPRHGKSELAKHFVAYHVGKLPRENVIYCSSTNDLAEEHAAQARDLIVDHGPSVFGVKIREDRQAMSRWAVEAGGHVYAAGVGKGIAGRGCSLLVIDDYFGEVSDALSETIRNRLYQWYLTTSKTRLTPDGSIILIATRWHPDDLIGKVLKTAEITGEKWQRITLQAIDDDNNALWPERFNLDWLTSRRKEYYNSGYPWQWEALYQQRPPLILDSEFKEEWFNDSIWAKEWPSPEQIRMVVTALDPSLGKTDKSDYSAYATVALGDEGTLWVDADISRRDAMTMVNDGVAIWRNHNPTAFGVESVGFQEVLGILFEDRSKAAGGLMLPLHMMSHGNNSKENRIRRLIPYLARGQIRIRKSPGGSLLYEQLKTFPSNKHDDGPDALEMAIRLLIYMIRGGADHDPIFSNVFE